MRAGYSRLQPWVSSWSHLLLLAIWRAGYPTPVNNSCEYRRLLVCIGIPTIAWNS